jgi:hypothetical protein
MFIFARLFSQRSGVGCTKNSALKQEWENSLTLHGKGNILGILPLALAPASLGLGQDDRSSGFFGMS